MSCLSGVFVCFRVLSCVVVCFRVFSVVGRGLRRLQSGGAGRRQKRKPWLGCSSPSGKGCVWSGQNTHPWYELVKKALRSFFLNLRHRVSVVVC
jgi:hypothetical protein